MHADTHAEVPRCTNGPGRCLAGGAAEWLGLCRIFTLDSHFRAYRKVIPPHYLVEGIVDTTV
jgi:hypothetical protein